MRYHPPRCVEELKKTLKIHWKDLNLFSVHGLEKMQLRKLVRYDVQYHYFQSVVMTFGDKK